MSLFVEIVRYRFIPSAFVVRTRRKYYRKKEIVEK